MIPKQNFWLSVLFLFTLVNSRGTDPPTDLAKNNLPPSLVQKVSFLAYTAKYSKNYNSTTEFNIRF